MDGGPRSSPQVPLICSGPAVRITFLSLDLWGKPHDSFKWTMPCTASCRFCSSLARHNCGAVLVMMGYNESVGLTSCHLSLLPAGHHPVTVPHLLSFAMATWWAGSCSGLAGAVAWYISSLTGPCSPITSPPVVCLGCLLGCSLLSLGCSCGCLTLLPALSLLLLILLPPVHLQQPSVALLRNGSSAFEQAAASPNLLHLQSAPPRSIYSRPRDGNKRLSHLDQPARPQGACIYVRANQACQQHGLLSITKCTCLVHRKC